MSRRGMILSDGMTLGELEKIEKATKLFAKQGLNREYAILVMKLVSEYRVVEAENFKLYIYKAAYITGKKPKTFSPPAQRS